MESPVAPADGGRVRDGRRPRDRRRGEPAAGSPSSVPVPGLDKLAGAARQQVQTLTLITGDTVRLSRSAAGQYQTQVRLAARADGRAVTVQTLVDSEHVYVLPSDALDLVAAGKLDRRLFDVRGLVDQGYADAATATLPVIVSYGRTAPVKTATARSKAKSDLLVRANRLPAGRSPRALTGINGAATGVTKKDAVAFWSAVRPSAKPALSGGLTNIWLDAKVSASLDVSVPLIGAPQAWAAGFDGAGVKVAVLDTGLDATHPDFAGKTIDSKSFIPGVTSTADGHGHGTHVSSIVLGSGAASGGRYKGVAPGAQLAVGKVLNDAGSGETSWILEGMEWAAVTEDADVVNMSIGSSSPGDGTDPMSLAVDELTASTGALFVIAAGNSGPGGRTVTAPGAAASALTVAAFDKQDHLADFSSRGPLTGNYALKPDIAAPGVAIAAARAAGTNLGGDVGNDAYTSLSGTSMAAPHVAGAAAILAQRHPDWTPTQLKAALTSTSSDGGYSAYEQGAGRVDVAAAVGASVVAATSQADFGRLRYPQNGPAVSRTVSYRNTGTTAVTLTLGVSLKTSAGEAAPAGMLQVSPSTLEIPAGGVGDAVLTLDPTMGTPSAYSGAVTATAPGVSLRVPVGAYKEPEGFELTTQVIEPATAAATVLTPVVIRRTDSPDGDWVFLAPGASAHLDKGVYDVSTGVVWADLPGAYNNSATLVDPQVELTADTTVTLDTNQAKRIVLDTGRPAENYGATSNIWHTPAGATAPFGVINWMPYNVQPWVTPTEKVTVGKFYYDHSHEVGTPQVTASAGALRLSPQYQDYSVLVAKLSGRTDLRLVDVGRGTEADFAGKNLQGKAVLLDIGEAEMLSNPSNPSDPYRLALAKGAAAVFAYSDTGRARVIPGLGGLPGLWPLPMMAITADEGAALKARVAKGQTTVRVESQPTIPELFSLSYLEADQVRADLRYPVRAKDLVQVRHESHANVPVGQSQMWSTRYPVKLPIDDFSNSFRALALNDLAGPLERTEYVGPVGTDATWYRYVNMDTVAGLQQGSGHTVDTLYSYFATQDVFAKPGRRTETWGKAPTVPGTLSQSADVLAMGPEYAVVCSVCRYTGLFPDGDMLSLFTFTSDSDGHAGELTTYSEALEGFPSNGHDEWHLYAGDTELPQSYLGSEPGSMPFYVLPAGTRTYRLTQDFRNRIPVAGTRGTTSSTTWTFTSADPTANDLPAGHNALGLCVDKCRVEPLLFLRYDLDVDGFNRSVAPGVQLFTVTAYRDGSTARMPGVAGMKVSASFDGGKRWTSVPVVPLGNGKYAVLLAQPSGTGTVSLRTEAWDTAGNRVVQTVPDAYQLIRR
ncbi:S8 family serine peptidase [Hamadaea sp. NPDC051192]|uniref:S8 family serine peptidase n=1 Tax=Hamadaea sp. NPDC051192 TaxID=3154940 RepID=UPI003413F9B3